jgi:hypothetical protein
VVAKNEDVVEEEGPEVIARFRQFGGETRRQFRALWRNEPIQNKGCPLHSHMVLRFLPYAGYRDGDSLHRAASYRAIYRQKFLNRSGASSV